MALTAVSGILQSLDLLQTRKPGAVQPRHAASLDTNFER